jgi:hypothetical protein
MICSKGFSLFVRTRHCHYCGWAVCGDCSPGRLVLDRWLAADKPNAAQTARSTKPLRVCSLCVPEYPAEQAQRDAEARRIREEEARQRREAEAQRAAEQVLREAEAQRQREAEAQRRREVEALAALQRRMEAEGLIAEGQEAVLRSGVKSVDQFEAMSDADFEACGVDIAACRRAAVRVAFTHRCIWDQLLDGAVLRP